MKMFLRYGMVDETDLRRAAERIMTFIWANLGRVLTSLGLVADIVGAVLVAAEVVRQFRGARYRTTASAMFDPEIVSAQTSETPEYERWEAWKYRRMRWGLGFLIGGFILQITGAWLV